VQDVEVSGTNVHTRDEPEDDVIPEVCDSSLISVVSSAIKVNCRSFSYGDIVCSRICTC